MSVDPDKRGNPPFEASSYAAGLERQVVRHRKWAEAAKTMARDMLDGDAIDKLAAEAWWRQQLDMPQVVLSVADLKAAVAKSESPTPLPKDVSHLVERLSNLDCVMVEVCQPHPSNPSRNIIPIERKHLLAALRTSGGDRGDV